jgi:RNA polymerase sigma factor for flagellar operon FliA
MLDALRALDWLPHSLRDKIRKVELASRELTQSLGREPSDEELADYAHFNIEEVRSLHLQAQQANIILMEEELQENVSYEDEQGVRQFRGIEEEEFVGILAQAINGLGEKEKLIITLYYYENMNLKEIGKVLNLTESRVSQLLSKTIQLLRQRLKYVRSEMIKS